VAAVTAIAPTAVEVDTAGNPQAQAGAPRPPFPQNRKALRRGRTRGIIVLLLVASVTLIPVSLLLLNSLNVAPPTEPARYGLDNWRLASKDPALREAIWNTVKLAIVRLPIAVVIATVLSWLIARTDMPGGRYIEVMLWAAFFVPSLSVTLGWILLLDPANGAINQLIRMLPGLGDVTSGPLNIFSLWGIVLAHISASTVPIMTILLIPSFRRMGASLEEVAQTCGASRWRTALVITVPLMAPALMGAALLSFIHSLKTFEIELLLGGPSGLLVYSTQIHQWINESPPAFGIATALGAVFIPILVALALLQRFAVGRRSFVTVGSHTFSDEPVRLGTTARRVASGLAFLYMTIMFVLPVTAILVGSFMRRFAFFRLSDPFTTAHWSQLFNDNLFTAAVKNSLILGFGSMIVGMVVYFAVAYAIVRSSLPTRGGIDVMAWLPVAVPGLLLGLGLLWLYLGTPLRTVLYGNLLGLMIAIVISHMATGTQQMKSAQLQVSNDLEMAARTCGASPIRANFHILLPILAPAIIAAGILTFDSAIREISTVVLLSSGNSRPMALLLLEYSTGGELEAAAALGVIISLLTVVVAVAARRLGGGRLKR
jgi:iron(III) transport system permease protein